MNTINNQTTETINPMTLIDQACEQWQPVPPALMISAYAFNKEQLLTEQAELEQRSVEIKFDVLNAVSSLKALGGNKTTPAISYIDLLKRLKTRGKSNDTQ